MKEKEKKCTIKSKGHVGFFAIFFFNKNTDREK